MVHRRARPPARRASLLGSASVWVLGLASAVSPASFQFCDDATTLYLLPIGGLAIALIAGWLIAREDREIGFTALGARGQRLAPLWTKLIRYVTPWLVVAVLV